MQQVTWSTVEMAYVDQGYTGPTAAEAAQSHGIGSKWSNTLWPNAASCCCRAAGWLNAASPWAARFRRLVRDYEQLDTTLKDFITSPSPAS